MWVFKLLAVLVRNQFFLKPLAWSSARAARQKIIGLGYKPKAVELHLGLGQSEQLHLLVVFRTDAELKKFRNENLEAVVRAEFMERLSKSYYPKRILMNSILFHSHEEIMRVGGCYFYFK